MFTNEVHNIQKQMRIALTRAKFISSEQASQIIYQCFDIEPKRDRLYQIRNDINHGNIRENSGLDYERVYFRGMLLQNIVLELLNRKLGHPISLGMSVNELAEKLKSPAFQKGEP
jgi:hypothetical protein